MPPLHVLIVHFPIALLLTSVALSWASMIWKDKGFDKASWYSLLLGLVATLVAIPTGLASASAIPADSAAMVAVNPHRILGIATFVVFALQAVIVWRSKAEMSVGARVALIALQVIGSLIVIVLGYFGGELVYRYGIGLIK